MRAVRERRELSGCLSVRWRQSDRNAIDRSGGGVDRQCLIVGPGDGDAEVARSEASAGGRLRNRDRRSLDVDVEGDVRRRFVAAEVLNLCGKLVEPLRQHHPRRPHHNRLGIANREERGCVAVVQHDVQRGQIERALVLIVNPDHRIPRGEVTSGNRFDDRDRWRDEIDSKIARDIASIFGEVGDARFERMSARSESEREGNLRACLIGAPGEE